MTVVRLLSADIWIAIWFVPLLFEILPLHPPWQLLPPEGPEGRRVHIGDRLLEEDVKFGKPGRHQSLAEIRFVNRETGVLVNRASNADDLMSAKMGMLTIWRKEGGVRGFGGSETLKAINWIYENFLQESQEGSKWSQGKF